MIGQLGEQQMWEAFQSGDEEAYTTIYRLHVKAMYRYGMSLVPVSEAFVFDCIHDVFTELWLKRKRLTVPDNVRFYLLKSLKVRILHLLKRKERVHLPLSEEDYDELWSEPSSVDHFVFNEELYNRQDLVRKLIDQLSPRQQEALRLRYEENMDYGEIASLLSINRQSAQNLVFRAVEKLRTWML
ncbi:sigma-70 family RNA polymerase sigma factor [Telluribacter sp.]|jgi:RNA polymerase sigma factor (sigma-70 family)|uniref:RNA polymerase sigma factor n=1 Tax=Telluribacter sp. TaxID=1978767 RepID=UPI002E0E16B5|nr:sigma-70 family RNA polymerase sigma factor [Telluribacter sp.]